MSIFTNAQTTNLKSGQSNYSVTSLSLNSPSNQNLEYTNPNWTKYYGYFNTISALRRAIISMTTWTVGKGYKVSPGKEIELDHLTGMGHDTFQTILENHDIVEQINGDAYTQILRKDNKDPRSLIINLKPLNPSAVKKIISPEGRIIKFQVRKADGTYTDLEPFEVFHTMADRIGDQIHGGSVVEACQWVIDAWMEAMQDQRTVIHRNKNPLKLFYLNTNDPVAYSEIKEQYLSMTQDYEALFVPGKKGDKFEVEIPSIPIVDSIPWIQYLESLFYQITGTPRIMATSEGVTEASGKIGYLTFEPTYTRRQQKLETALWKQLGLMITFNRPAELAGSIQSSEAANTGQLGFQPNDMMAQVGRQ